MVTFNFLEADFWPGIISALPVIQEAIPAFASVKAGDRFKPRPSQLLF